MSVLTLFYNDVSSHLLADHGNGSANPTGCVSVCLCVTLCIVDKRLNGSS